MSKDFVAGVIFTLLILALIVIVSMIVGGNKPPRTSKRQPVADESKWGDLTDDERETLRKGKPA
jgi:hypothetical protein